MNEWLEIFKGGVLVSVAGLIIAAVYGVVSTIIHDISWRVRWAKGWRPKIFIPKLVDETVERLADLSLRDEVANARKKFDYEMPAEQQEQYRAHVSGFIRAVIEEYTAVFAFNSLERNPPATAR